jgi:SAM-dependent methyltransferase
MVREHTLRVPLRLRRGALARDEDRSIESARLVIDHMCRDLGLDDLGRTDVLDIGCGVKFTQALLKHSLPIGRYVGVDVYKEMIDFLRENVTDPRFEYHHVDVHNALYNPGGQPLGPDAELPVGDRGFDVICLFSVFTHVEPHDYVSLLRVSRRYIKPSGRLYFTLYIDELTENGYGVVDHLANAFGASFAGQIETFKDLSPPDRPLHWAVYSEAYARRLVDQTGWNVELLAPPAPHIQHHFICTPRGSDAWSV